MLVLNDRKIIAVHTQDVTFSWVFSLRGHETVTTEHLLMESPDCIKQPQNHGSVCSRGDSLTDVQRLLSARLSDSNC